MPFAGNNLKISVLITAIYKTVCIVNPAREPLSMSKWLRLPDTCHKTLALYVSYERIDSLEYPFVYVGPTLIIV
jgi:hypothetical protein